jgi:hypothetical protein
MSAIARILLAVALVALVGGVLVVILATRPGRTVEDRKVRDRYEWWHALQVVSNLKAARPKQPVVVLVGGSSGREATVDDRSWTRELRRASGTSATAVNLCTSEQTIAQSLALVQELPPMQAVVYVGVSVGRLSHGPGTDRPLRLPEPSSSVAYDQHRYSEDDELPPSQKLSLLRQWSDSGPRQYARWHETSFAELADLLTVCKEKRYVPVLVYLPVNGAIVGSDLRAERTVADARSQCRRLAASNDVAFIDINVAARLTGADFRDLWHLRGGGREKCQRALSSFASRLLRARAQ